MNTKKAIILAFEAGYQLGYSDSNNGIHIKLEKVVERFMNSEFEPALSSPNDMSRFAELEMASDK
ncbi:hypothetical protein [Pseudoalteromonas luteoviolacea]|uniref:hypothetical protein n=1 Tax=Pseudoalteromonas luteoviolacea TaxID=43657 RepID=UPI001B36D222|nr:hypothetical protein [Pseudoalteromonas luteoviolacea]MBQ4839749.1 hypothetical protein [Pseudoalteromonas luteoviolacea]